MQRVNVMVAALAYATAVSAENCVVGGVTGNCIHTSQCTSSGVLTSGKCEGPSSIKCCTYGKCAVDAIGGDCILTSTCSGKSTAGKCPGPSGVQCCTPDYGTCTVSGVKGECIGASACTGTRTSGKCPGPADVQCCTPPPPPPVSSGEVPQAGLELIQKFEGLRLSAYPDPLTGNLPITIGYGSTRKLDGSAWVLGDTITKATAVQLLEKQVQDKFLPPLEAIPVWGELNTNQRGAILSFAYNLGAHFYGKSSFTTITRVLREKQWDQIRAALVLYRNPGSSVEAGLRRRREAEADLFLKPL
eukprot:TRINITY_DN1008_c0_g1_i3.p1 TRINITY_DN1008_c0_g1~~TRINITY_DN1008_c0_g1_i3.p1  ORF type:complete len:302 (+),score=109.01 TRINITY_DN1008_c0_g1_i3:61-966(+)